MAISRVKGKRLDNPEFPVVIAFNQRAAEKIAAILTYAEEIGHDISKYSGFSHWETVNELRKLREALTKAGHPPAKKKFA